MMFPKLAGLFVAAIVALSPVAASAQRPAPPPFRDFNVVPITITSVTPQNGGLVANGVIGSNTFSTPITLATSPNPNLAAACPILDLQLGPINLNVLGLNVDTSPICLDVIANQGQGLLGDLLCGIANLLNGGTPIGEILAGLNETQLSTLNAGLTTLLNQAVFIPISSSPSLVGATCNVLNLAIGPLDLNLLGLSVALDNCSDGPVTLDITAQQGGGLLGDLLCGLSNLLNNPAQRLKILAQIAAVLSGIFG